jgi:hypothetical protein
MIDYGVGTYFADIDAAEAFVATPTERRAATLAGLAAPLTDYAAWVTWDFDEPTEPFAFASGKDADWVCGCLGLDPRRVSRPVALLEYAAPPGLCRPTVADAGLNTNFSPPIAGEERCGFTRPLDDAVRLPPPLEDTVEDNVMPRPEALHHSLRTDEVDLEWEVKL